MIHTKPSAHAHVRAIDQKHVYASMLCLFLALAQAKSEAEAKRKEEEAAKQKAAAEAKVTTQILHV